MRYTLALLLGSITLSSGCATGTHHSARDYTEALSELTNQDGRSCIRTSSINGYGVNNGIISINAGRKYYLVTTLYTCHSLELETQAAFSSRFPQICGRTNAYVLTREGRCPIDKVFEFDNRQSAFEALDAIDEKLADAPEENKAE